MTIRRLAWMKRAKYCDGSTSLPGKSLLTAGEIAWVMRSRKHMNESQTV